MRKVYNSVVLHCEWGCLLVGSSEETLDLVRSSYRTLTGTKRLANNIEDTGDKNSSSARLYHDTLARVDTFLEQVTPKMLIVFL